MVVVDIRNFFAVRNVEIIEINDKFIYYAEEKNQEGHNNLFLLEYNRVTRRERIISNYSLDDPTFVQHIFSFPDSILLLLENGTDSVWIFRVDKNTGEETAKIYTNVLGAFAGCKALDSNNVIIYTALDDSSEELKKYKEQTDCDYIAYMHDIQNDKKYFIKNSRVWGITPENILVYTSEQEANILLLEPYGDEALKEKCYKNARWISTEVCDYIWTCPLKSFIQSVKLGEKNLNLKLIAKASTDGMARFMGFDEGYLYFRAKHFPTQKESICSCALDSGKIEIKADLTYEDNCYYHIDKKETKVYMIKEQNDITFVKGVINSRLNGHYNSSTGVFLGCIEDRFIITRKIVNDDNGNYDFEYTYICDVSNKTEESFECKCQIKGDTLVLY